jgi:hypothetical protein
MNLALPTALLLLSGCGFDLGEDKPHEVDYEMSLSKTTLLPGGCWMWASGPEKWDTFFQWNDKGCAVPLETPGTFRYFDGVLKIIEWHTGPR